MPKDSGIGASSKRREDVRFLTGAGNYTDDINIRGQAYVYFLRSDIAHGKINKIDTSDAEAMPATRSRRWSRTARRRRGMLPKPSSSTSRNCLPSST